MQFSRWRLETFTRFSTIGQSFFFFFVFFNTTSSYRFVLSGRRVFRKSTESTTGTFAHYTGRTNLKRHRFVRNVEIYETRPSELPHLPNRRPARSCDPLHHADRCRSLPEFFYPWKHRDVSIVTGSYADYYGAHDTSSVTRVRTRARSARRWSSRVYLVRVGTRDARVSRSTPHTGVCTSKARSLFRARRKFRSAETARVSSHNRSVVVYGRVSLVRGYSNTFQVPTQTRVLKT